MQTFTPVMSLLCLLFPSIRNTLGFRPSQTASTILKPMFCGNGTRVVSVDPVSFKGFVHTESHFVQGTYYICTYSISVCTVHTLYIFRTHTIGLCHASWLGCASRFTMRENSRAKTDLRQCLYSVQHFRFALNTVDCTLHTATVHYTPS
jgi:hypothetical protein